MTVIVREADDAFDRWDELYGLLTRSFAYMEGRIDPPSSLLRMTPADLAAKWREETLLVATEDGTLVGCAFVRLDADCAHVGKFAVDEKHRGHGLARQLLAVAEEVAVRSGRNALTLQTRVELSENHAAFARLGFVQTSETAHPGYHRPTSITMRRPIAARHEVRNAGIVVAMAKEDILA